MSYLLDTDVVSEFMKRRPDGRVSRWFQSFNSKTFYLSVITVGEIRRGIEEKPHGHKRERLDFWLRNELPELVGRQLLQVDRDVADYWGRLMALRDQVPAVDALLAATAIVHNLELATRDTDHFWFPNLKLVNPWELA